MKFLRKMFQTVSDSMSLKHIQLNDSDLKTKPAEGEKITINHFEDHWKGILKNVSSVQYNGKYGSEQLK